MAFTVGAIFTVCLREMLSKENMYGGDKNGSLSPIHSQLIKQSLYSLLNVAL